MDKKVDTNDRVYRFSLQVFYDRLKYYSNDKKYKIDNKIEKFCYENLEENIKEKAKNIKKRIFERYTTITFPWSIFDIQDPEIKKHTDALTFIFDTEELIYTSVTENLTITQKEIEEIISLYFLLYRNQNLIESTKFLITGIMLRMSLKAFKDAKKYYFKNNQETLYIELESLENKVSYYETENKKLKQEIGSFKSENDRLRNEYKKSLEKRIVEMEKEIDGLKQELEEYKENEKELFALRETMFDLGRRNENAAVYNAIDKEIKIPHVKALIVGGHENWRKKLQEELPASFKFLDGNKENFDIHILHDVDYVFLYTGYMNHGTYYKIMNYCKKNNITIGYISSTAVDLVKYELVKKIKIQKD
ncbi:DUF2325 domain-containing protein [Thermotalea metallivorans]|uniref:DUF2325 domain-containing protein n=1 Tax=Thermotalea metallivorans TaxID=520762 RepID=A0A140L848_9FIRM|nr:DUF2325 domain-containing protein [Thermotalea metallivorans]KXG76723.1 hypothetical protein AN619_08730 [Thermotalea metallivorans]